MDLNQLYFTHQLLLIQADQSVSTGTRRMRETAASQIACRIGALQRQLGANSAAAWEAMCGTPAHAACAS